MRSYKVLKKRVSPWLIMRRALGVFFLLLLSFFVGIVFYFGFFRSHLKGLLAKVMGIDVTLLCFVLFFVFIVGCLLLLLIFYWAGWNSLRFRLMQRRYRSSMMVDDYYKDRRRIKYDHFFGGLDRLAQRKLDLADKEKEEQFLYRLDMAGGRLPGGNIAFKDGKLDGTFISYYSDGKIESEVSYKEGRLDGMFHAYYMDGHLRLDKFYKAGKLEGVFKAWDEDGSIFFEIEYKDGKQEGSDKTFYRSGVLQYLDIYQEGQLVHRKTYDEGGNLQFEEDF